MKGLPPQFIDLFSFIKATIQSVPVQWTLHIKYTVGNIPLANKKKHMHHQPLAYVPRQASNAFCTNM